MTQEVPPKWVTDKGKNGKCIFQNTRMDRVSFGKWVR
jgi:hypothetical protein